jgi:hypothetical protein
MTETIQAKIRNKLTPFWTLTQMMGDAETWLRVNSTEAGRKVVNDCVAQCNANKEELLSLIDQTEDKKIKL